MKKHMGKKMGHDSQTLNHGSTNRSWTTIFFTVFRLSLLKYFGPHLEPLSR